MIDEPSYHVFLSYHKQNETAARLIAERLQAEHGVKSWLHVLSAIPGRLSQAEQERGLAQSQACAVLIGAAGVRQWQQLDVYAAISRRSEAEGGNFPVIPVFLPECPAEAQEAMPDKLRLFEPVRLTTLDDQPGLARLAAGVRGEPALSTSITLPDEPAPYRGLLPFEAEHARFFFGRDDDVRRLVQKLGQQRFVAVVGASGSGKSSLVMAGLLPRLAQNALPDSALWKVLRMTPGSEPLRSLASQLATLAPLNVDRLQAADTLVERLAARQDGLRSAAAAYLAENPQPLLLFVDQFEELFTQCREGQERCRVQTEQFVANLADAVEQGGGQVRVLITVRADFLERCLALPALCGLLEDRQVLLGPMDEPALHEAIVRPAREVGALFEKGLESAILRDCAVLHIANPIEAYPPSFQLQAGALPLLEFALNELWRRREGPWLTLGAYETSGGVIGALQRRAEAVYCDLSPEHKSIARSVFVRLTALGEGTPDSCRRVVREELYFVGTERNQVDTLIGIMSGTQVRLLVVDGQNVEVAHEALIRGWPTLRNWLEEDRNGLRVHRHLTNAAMEWLQHEGDEDFLYRGARLSEANEWYEKGGWDLNPSELRFLDAANDLQIHMEMEREAQRHRESMALRRQIHAESERAQAAEQYAQEQMQTNRRLRRQAWALLIALLVVIVVFTQWNRQALVTTAQKLAAEARKSADEGNYQIAALLDIEASRLSQTAGGQTLNQVPYEAAHYSAVVLGAHLDSVIKVAWSPDGRRLASGALDGRVIVWNAENGRPITVLGEPKSQVLDLAWHHNGKLLAAATAGYNRIIIWNVDAGQVVSSLEGHSEIVRSVAWSPDGRLLASGSDDENIIIWDPNSGQVLSRLQAHSGAVRAVAWSPDGQYLASGSWDNCVIIWNIDTGQSVARFQGHSDPVFSLAWHPNLSQLASGSSDNRVLIWDTRTGQATAFLDAGSIVTSLAWQRDGKLLASATADGNVVIWDTETAKLASTLKGHSTVWSVAWSPDGRRVASGSSDSYVTIWDIEGGQRASTLKGHRAYVYGIAWDPIGRRLASGSFDERIFIWNAQTDYFTTILEGHADAVYIIAWRPSGERLASGSEDGSVVIWDTETGELISELKAHTERVYGLSWNPDSVRLASASHDKRIIIWDTATGTPISVLEGHGDQVRSVDWNPDGRYLASGSLDKRIIIWDTESGQATSSLESPGGITRVIWHPDGKRLASSTMEGDIIIWDTSSGQALLTLKEPSTVWDLAWHPDGKKLASGASDGQVKIWDTDTATPITTVQANTHDIFRVAWSPDGAFLASSSADSTVRILPEVFTQPPCNWLLRNLSLSEWHLHRGWANYRPACTDLPGLVKPHTLVELLRYPLWLLQTTTGRVTLAGVSVAFVVIIFLTFTVSIRGVRWLMSRGTGLHIHHRSEP